MTAARGHLFYYPHHSIQSSHPAAVFTICLSRGIQLEYCCLRSCAFTRKETSLGAEWFRDIIISPIG